MAVLAEHSGVAYEFGTLLIALPLDFRPVQEVFLMEVCADLWKGWKL